MDIAPQLPITQSLPSAEINVIDPAKQDAASQRDNLQHEQAQATNEFLEGQDDNEFAEKAVTSDPSQLPASIGRTTPSSSGERNNAPINPITQRADSRRYSQPPSMLERKSAQRDSNWARNSKGKFLTVSLLERRDNPNMPEDSPYLDIELKIKEIARAIRQKIKKYSPPSRANQSRTKNTDHSQQQRPRDVVLSSIKPNNSNRLVPSDDSKLLTFQQSHNQTIDSDQLVRDIVKKDILERVWARIDLNEKLRGHKLKLDPIKHKYPMSTFRKAVLQEERQAILQEEARLREREQKLIQRRIIYKSSRYDRYIQRGKSNHGRDRMGDSLVLPNPINSNQQEFMQNPEALPHEGPKESLFATQIQIRKQEQPSNETQIQPIDPSLQQDYGEDFL